MSAWTALLITVIVGVATYAMRAVAIVGLAGRTIPPAVERALRNVGPAVLAALAINLAAGGHGGAPSMSWPEAAALAVAGVAAWRSRNLIVTLVAGMTTLWVLSALV